MQAGKKRIETGDGRCLWGVVVDDGKIERERRNAREFEGGIAKGPGKRDAETASQSSGVARGLTFLG